MSWLKLNQRLRAFDQTFSQRAKEPDQPSRIAHLNQEMRRNMGATWPHFSPDRIQFDQVGAAD
jgi:hypothetical protein